jgi:hypothetical protein
VFHKRSQQVFVTHPPGDDCKFASPDFIFKTCYRLFTKVEHISSVWFLYKAAAVVSAVGIGPSALIPRAFYIEDVF